MAANRFLALSHLRKALELADAVSTLAEGSVGAHANELEQRMTLIAEVARSIHDGIACAIGLVPGGDSLSGYLDPIRSELQGDVIEARAAARSNGADRSETPAR